MRDNIRRRYSFEVSAHFAGYTIEEFLAHHIPHYNQAFLRKMIFHKNVTVNQETLRPKKQLQALDNVKVLLPPAEEITVDDFFELEVLYEDDNCIVLNKPSGIPVIGERWSHENVFKDRIALYLKQKEEIPEPRIVHRIDKDASGVVIVAKDRDSERYLSELFVKRKIEKIYRVLVVGVPPAEGSIDSPIAPASKNSIRMVVDPAGKSALTHYQVKERFRDYSLLGVKIETGRTHQIRVHLSSLGYPLAVDPLYGYRECLRLSDFKPDYQPKPGRIEKPLISRLSLHAYEVTFRKQDQSENITVQAPLPKDFQVILKQLRKYRR